MWDNSVTPHAKLWGIEIWVKKIFSFSEKVQKNHVLLHVLNNFKYPKVSHDNEVNYRLGHIYGIIR